MIFGKRKRMTTNPETRPFLVIVGSGIDVKRDYTNWNLLCQLYRYITSAIPEQGYCNTLSCLTAHRHRISASSQCMPLPFAVP